MIVGVLGPLTVWGREPIEFGASRQVRMMAALAVEANRVVPVDRLVDALWEEPPDTARRQIRNRVASLRRQLAGHRLAVQILTDGPGYRLRIDPEEVDAAVFVARVASARRLAAGGQAVAAVRAYGDALALWRGPALAGLPGRVLRAAAARLDEQRMVAVEERAELCLRLGDAAAVVEELLGWVGEQPARESTVGLLMRALYGCGRQSEALAVYGRLRDRLADDLGVDPDPRLQALHTSILRADPALEGTEAPGTAPARPGTRPPTRFTLPPDVIAFTGRDEELQAIAATVADTASDGGVVAIHAIDGMPGVGKTALAVHAGHRLAERFPDRQLFIDLHAHTPGRQPVEPPEALAELLIADGVDPRQLPDSLDGRQGMWRDRMAGKRVLIVLDNAAGTAQVAPLLPGAAGCLVLVTSRRRLADLPAHHVLLDVLPADDAVEMFLRLAPHAKGEPDTAAELVEACGYLPLAIGITGSLYTRHPTWTLAQLVAEVRARRLTATGENRSVKAAFDLSYHHLPERRRRFFRLLGLHPGVELDDHAAAALTGLTPDATAGELTALYNDHLLEETSYRRYRMHDLIRFYAHSQAVTADPDSLRERAIGRLLDYYQHTAHRANAHLARDTRPAGVPADPPDHAPELTGWDQAAAWLRVERGNLLACVQHAADRAQHARVVGLTAGVAALLRIDGPWVQAVALLRAAVTAARHLGHRAAYADALYNLGMVRQLTGDYSAATDVLEQAGDLYRALGDQQGLTNTLVYRAMVRYLTGDYAGAAVMLERAAERYRGLGDRQGLANSLNHLGTVRYLTGDYRGATAVLEESGELHRDLGDRAGLANALRHLGTVAHLTGDYPGATDLLERARDLYQAVDNRYGAANSVFFLGLVRRLTGDYPGATALLEQARDVYGSLDNRHGYANAVSQLGVVRYLSGDHPGAAAALEHARDLHAALGDRHGHAAAICHLGVVRCLTGRYAEAGELLQQALTDFRAAGTRDDEAAALNHLGTLHRLSGRPERARSLHGDALTVARGIHHPLEEAHALDGLGRAALDLGDTAAAVDHLRRAGAIYQILGVPEAARVGGTLTTLRS
jgi:DNA-binding SARP family transcriptional activator/tetratricopeptide (TPR) repeat protein